MIYNMVNGARLMGKPKHPGLKPVRLSWEKAYGEVAQFLSKMDQPRALISIAMSDGKIESFPVSLTSLTTARLTGINLSNGAIRAAYPRGKKIADVVEKIGSQVRQIKTLVEKSAKKP